MTSVAESSKILLRYKPFNQQVKVPNQKEFTCFWEPSVAKMHLFKSEDGADGPLAIPSGGELWLEPSTKEVDKHNYAILVKMNQVGLLAKEGVELVDLEAEEDKELKARELRREALDKVREVIVGGDTKFIKALILRLGLPFDEGITEKRVRGELERYAEANPSNFLALLTDQELPKKILIDEAIRSNVIKIDGDNFFFGATRMGISEQAVLDYITKHEDIGELIQSEVSRINNGLTEVYSVQEKEDVSVDFGISQKDVEMLISAGVVKQAKKGNAKEFIYRGLPCGDSIEKVTQWFNKQPVAFNAAKKEAASKK